jgi:nucleoside-diphosphate-sugar epimerase
MHRLGEHLADRGHEVVGLDGLDDVGGGSGIERFRDHVVGLAAREDDRLQAGSVLDSRP